MKTIILMALLFASSNAAASPLAPNKSHWGEYSTLEEAQATLNVCHQQMYTLNIQSFVFLRGEFIGSMSPTGAITTTYKILFEKGVSHEAQYATLILEEKIFSTEDDTEFGSTTELKCLIKHGDQVVSY